MSTYYIIYYFDPAFLIVSLIVILVSTLLKSKGTIRVDGTGGAEGAQAPPSFLDLYSKNLKISQILEELFFSI